MGVIRMKKVICLVSALALLLCGCNQTNPAKDNTEFQNTEPNDSIQSEGNVAFIKNENSNLVSTSGVEYVHLANEGFLYYLGELEFWGSVQGEEQTSQHLIYSYQTGMFNIKNSDNDNILIRREPNNEWFSIYRKSSLPTFDFSTDNCIRLEFVSGMGNIKEDIFHTTCNGGIVDNTEIEKFFFDVRSQDNPRDAGIYELVKKPNGMFENCYVCGVVYGFFKDEPNLVIKMKITSYNDLAYSISIGNDEYVLPKLWFNKLLTTKCTT